MDSIDVGDAKMRIDELVGRAEAGETVEITRDGKPVARLSGVVTTQADPRPRQPLDIEKLRAMTAGMRMQPEESGDFMRRIRDEERY